MTNTNIVKANSNSLKNKKYVPFVIDWIIIITLFILKYSISKITPLERHFRIDDETINYPYKGDTIKMIYLIIVDLTISIIIITIIQFYKKNLKYNYHQAIIGLLLSCLISTLFVNVIKVIAGRYRPDFISVCNVDYAKVEEQYNYYNKTGNDFGQKFLFNTTICKASKNDLKNERKSFPSGHSSFAFSTMTFLALYIAGQIHLLDRKCHLWKFFVVCIPFLCAVTIPLSRVYDYRHHWQDVTVGSIIGLFFGYLAYYYIYPSLRSPDCDIPYQRCKENTQIETENEQNKDNLEEIV